MAGQEIPLAPSAISKNLKYVEEKPVSAPLMLLEWSSRMDLVAAATKPGDAQLYRLNWTRIWSRPPMEPGIRINFISWRPDGKLVAFAYSSGQVMLREIENGETVHLINMDSEVTSMRWSVFPVVEEDEALEDKKIPVDTQLVPTPPPLSKCFGMKGAAWDDKGQKKVMDEDEPSILVISASSQSCPVVKFFAHGVFLCGSFPVQLGCKGPSLVRCAILSDDCRRLYLVTEDVDKRESMFQVFDCSYLADSTTEIVYMAKICAELGSLMQYSSRCMQGIREGVENLAMEFESKMDPLREKIGMSWEGRADSEEATTRRFEILAQVAELEAYGCLTNNPENDFVQELGNRRVKKMRTALEQGHINVHTLLTEYFSKASTAITHNAAKLRGLSKCQHRLGFLGLDEKKAQRMLATSFQLVHKTREFQQILNSAFLPFLEQGPDQGGDAGEGGELSKAEKRAIRKFVVGILEPFVRYEYDEVLGDCPDDVLKGPGYQTPLFEPISQYMKDEELMFAYQEHPLWRKLMMPSADGPGLPEDSADSLIFDKKFQGVSLLTALKECVNSVQAFIEERDICGLFKPVGERLPLLPLSEEVGDVRLSARAVDGLLLLRFTASDTEPMKIVLLDPNPETGKFGALSCNFLRDDENGLMRQLDVNDADFYSEDSLSLLLYGNSLPPTLYQAPVKDLRRHIVCGEIKGQAFSFKISDALVLDDVSVGPGTKLAVNGVRKVAAILFRDKMRVRVMETEYVEDDDDDEEEEEEEAETSRGETVMVTPPEDTPMAEVHSS